MDDILIVGGGIGGLTLALFLHKIGVSCRIYESANVIKPLGMGINLLPYATEKFAQLGILDKLSAVAIETKESLFCNRFGQIIHRRPAGKFAGYKHPQLSIHRADLHNILLSEVENKIGSDKIHLGWKCINIIDNHQHITANFVNSKNIPHPKQYGKFLIGCDGIHSKVRQLLYPNEENPLYHGINMWRGVSEWEPILSGASMLRIGLPKIGKLVVYPIKNSTTKPNIQLINWVVEIEISTSKLNNLGPIVKLEDFIDYFSSWKFPWLDVPNMLKAHIGQILQYPMIDKNPLNQWNFGRINLLGDAAHPMVPLGSNGAGQAILDAAFLAECLSENANFSLAFKKYEEIRLFQTSQITRIDRAMLQDRLLSETHIRTNDKPFASISDIFSVEELNQLSEPTYNLIS
jgi:2-polyprenyl-6-methoxyphenol hydroxylase-like FAD-dependent oxidoreductase